AQKRGVEVRVLIDDVGARYSWPSIFRWLRNEKIPAAAFMPTWAPWIVPYANLRNHRKLLIIDGATGFTGGMNIRASHSSEKSCSRRTEDLHFRMRGPVVSQMQNVFVEDWRFTTGELLSGAKWFPEIASQGDVLARSVSAGPDEEYERLRMTILAALSCAEQSVRIVTPYFVPDRDIITALNLASMRGVEVDILLPQVNNLCFVQWASTAILWQVLERGCRVWYVPPPFDHTKLMLVDGVWTFLGSSNWDARSLRLNFELNVECYDPSLTQRLELMVEEKRSRSMPITLADVDGRSIPRKLRDGLARLLSPYL
ncbi:MAG: phospholipase D-like domain-containing protein, partial [Pirellulaceae bacterium]|nr:phospholipase D-like domain-containing protein [Pirellulaceae bacterium]